MNTDIKAARDQACEFAAQHALALALEILEWKDTGLLRDGLMRELAALCCPFAAHDALQVAESIAIRAALNRCAALAQQPVEFEPRAALIQRIPLAPDPGDELHGRIMNLPIKLPSGLAKLSTASAYKAGHRDARHAAAELVGEVYAAPQAQPDALDADIAAAPTTGEQVE